MTTEFYTRVLYTIGILDSIRWATVHVVRSTLRREMYRKDAIGFEYIQTVSRLSTRSQSPVIRVIRFNVWSWSTLNRLHFFSQPIYEGGKKVNSRIFYSIYWKISAIQKKAIIFQILSLGVSIQFDDSIIQYYNNTIRNRISPYKWPINVVCVWKLLWVQIFFLELSG